MIRTLALLAAAGLIAAASACPALAHAHLRSEIPVAGGTAPSPEALTLQFSEGLELSFTGIVLTGPNGVAVATGPAHLAAGDPARLIVPVAGKLVPGPYRVEWRAVATDGHKTNGSYRFTVAP